MKGIASREMAELEKKHKKKVSEISKLLGDYLKKSPKKIEKYIHERIEKLPETEKLKIKKHLVQIGTPILFGYLVTSMAGGHPEEIALFGSIIAGLIVGQIESHEIGKKIAEAEKTIAEKTKRKLGMIT